MNAPTGGGYDGGSPFQDPSQVFGDVSPDEQAMPGDPNAMQGPPGQPPPTGEPEGDPIDLEGALAHAIEAGCQQATAALETSAEDYMRFCQGVSFLADAFAKLQPQPHPAAAAAIQADQRQTQADQQHVRETTKLALDASRPTEPQPSARG